MNTTNQGRGDDRGTMRTDDPFNRDPITNAPGSHPVGTGVGAGVGGTVGAAVGSVAGPAGTVAGAAVGAIAGGLLGKGVAEAVNPTAEIDYWRTAYTTRPYYVAGRKFEEYEPAYRYGVDVYSANPNRTWEEAEPKLRDEWSGRKESARLAWDQASDAVKDAWDRVAHRRDGASPSAKKEIAETNEVIQALHDSAAGFRKAADKVVNTPQRGSLLRFAQEREQFIAELKPLVTAQGGSPASSGSMKGSLERGWMALAGALGAGDKAVIQACERAEDSTLNAYRCLLEDGTLTPVMRETVARQFQRVRDTQDQVKSWSSMAQS
jgi:uncharacterized protein (TIGR02284 family)